MDIIILGSYHSVLSCWLGPTNALSVWHRQRAGSGAIGVLIIPHLSSRVGLEALWIRLFSGFPVCGHLPRGDLGPKLQSELDLPMELDVWRTHDLYLVV
jgi:hypothetical protein